jgi:hypothetical protein
MYYPFEGEKHRENIHGFRNLIKNHPEWSLRGPLVLMNAPKHFK